MCLLCRVVVVDLVTQTIELLEPCFGHSFTGHRGVECIFAELEILLFVSVGADGAFDCVEEVFAFVCEECEAAACLAVPHKFKDRVFQSTSAEGDNGSATDKELMLHNTTRLKLAWHEPEVGTSINKRAIRKEEQRVSPEAVGVLLLKTEHPLCALPRVRVGLVSWPSHKELHLIVVLFDDFFGHIEDEVDALLVGDSADEGKDRDVIVEVGVVEVLLLQHPLGLYVVRGCCV